MLGAMKGFVQTVRTFFRKNVTVQYPYERMPLAPRYMGAPGLLYDKKVDEIVCVACRICERACPDDCISMIGEKYTGTKTKKKNIVTDYWIDLARCSYCGICVEVCPFDANEMTHHIEMSYYNSDDMVYDMHRLVEIADNMNRRFGKETPKPQRVRPGSWSRWGESGRTDRSPTPTFPPCGGKGNLAPVPFPDAFRRTRSVIMG